MENFKHTPGPWRFVLDGEYTNPYKGGYKTHRYSVLNNDLLIATVWEHEAFRNTETAKASEDNAHLIAAAPELLEALCNAIKFIKCSPHLAHEEMRPKGLESWETIIAKATNQKEVENESI